MLERWHRHSVPTDMKTKAANLLKTQARRPQVSAASNDFLRDAARRCYQLRAGTWLGVTKTALRRLLAKRVADRTSEAPSRAVKADEPSLTSTRSLPHALRDQCPPLPRPLPQRGDYWIRSKPACSLMEQQSSKPWEVIESDSMGLQELHRCPAPVEPLPKLLC